MENDGTVDYGATVARPAGSRGLLMAGVAVAVLAFVFLIANLWIGRDDGPTEVPVQDAAAEPTGEPAVGLGGVEPTAVGLLHVIELRGRPDYRIAVLDPSTGAAGTAFAIPETAVVYDLAHDPTADRLFISYTADFTVDGNGIYALDDVSTGTAQPRNIVPEVEGVLYGDVVASPDGGTIWATQITRNPDGDTTAVVEFAVTGGPPLRTIPDAIQPAVGPEWVAYLPVAEDDATPSIGVLPRDGGNHRLVQVLDNRFDLDLLLHDPFTDRLVVAALVNEAEPFISLGAPADAHGSHDGPSQWITVDPDTAEVAGPLIDTPVVVWDATILPSGVLAYTTDDGLMLWSDGGEFVLTETNALRSVAAG